MSTVKYKWALAPDTDSITVWHYCPAKPCDPWVFRHDDQMEFDGKTGQLLRIRRADDSAVLKVLSVVRFNEAVRGADKVGPCKLCGTESLLEWRRNVLSVTRTLPQPTELT